ncbi:MAG: ABC transporter ATP-binding protein [Myxococcales bacterium]|nr:ABC transporter ATP-binding protein [Myxococcales bacterium]
MPLALDRVHKRYGEAKVLDDVTLALVPGRIRALVGENGAGKSTLVKVACGLIAPDQGEVRYDRTTVTGWSASEATQRGVGVVHQHFTLVDTLSVADNVVLGREPRRGPLGLFVDRAAARARVAKLGKEFGLEIDPDRAAGDLAVGERQRVELLRVLDGGARCVLLDEPTAVLSPQEIRSLLDVLRSLARDGAALMFISHKLEEVFAIADDITVLRRGRIVLDAPTKELDRDAVARAVVGGDVPTVSATRTSERDETVALALTDVVCEGLRSVSLELRRGEVLGIAGVEGNGQRALFEAIAGTRPVASGRIALAGSDATRRSTLERRRAGLGYVPEDREQTGLCAALSIAENLALGATDVAEGDAVLSDEALRAKALAVIERYDVRPQDPAALVLTLSGGNAQKILVARELERSLSVLLLAQPTRGVDLGAAAAIRRRVLEARDKGLAVLLVSSELDELRTLSDRVAVMFNGRIVATMPVERATDEALGPLMIGAETSRDSNTSADNQEARS